MAYRMGLDIDLFWTLNPNRMKPFIEAFEDKRHEERDMCNLQAYLTGLYVQHAIASCLSKKAQYPDKPIDLRDSKEIQEFQSSPQFIEQQRLIMLTKMKQDERAKRRAQREKKGRWLDNA